MADQPPVPASFGQLALRVATALYEDIHVNLSGCFFFAAIAVGIMRPELADQCKAIVYYAGIYLFAASKPK